MATLITDASVVDSFKSGRMGPVTRRSVMRTATLYGIVFVAGLAAILAGAAPGWQAFVQGLWLPGGGFIAAGGWSALLFLPTLAVFALAVFVWFGAGLVVVPALVWLAAAGLAAWLAPATSWEYGPLVNIALVASFVAWRVKSSAKANAAGRLLFERRTALLPTLVSKAHEVAVEPPELSARELSLEQLASLRYALDRALQPIESWNGFEVIDEFQSAARRYQLNGLGYALSLSQTHYTPSFHGYLSEAQRNLIERYRLPEVWRYWVYEAIGGHLNFTNFDPAAKDNIMLTAFYAHMVGLYMSATGDRRYLEPGSLPFRLNARTTYSHDFSTIVQSVIDNFNSSPFCLYPCEPNWVYPICNHFGMSSLKLYDRMVGTDHFDAIFPRWLEGVDEEFTGPSGTIIGVRSSYTGFEFKFPHGDLGLSLITNGFMRKRAWRMWAVGRDGVSPLVTTDEEGQPCLRTSGPGFDGGFYRPGHGRTMATIAATAREFGDGLLATAALNTLDRVGGRREDGGVLRFSAVSNLGNATAVQARIGGKNFWGDAVAKGVPAHIYTAPILVEAAYPAVQVARAYSSGADLSLVLYPGDDASSEQVLGFERLQPGRPYTITGSLGGQLVADHIGRARLNVKLIGRTLLHLQPANS